MTSKQREQARYLHSLFNEMRKCGQIFGRLYIHNGINPLPSHHSAPMSRPRAVLITGKSRTWFASLDDLQKYLEGAA